MTATRCKPQKDLNAHFWICRPQTLTAVGSLGLVFGVQRLVPSYDQRWYKALKKPRWVNGPDVTDVTQMRRSLDLTALQCKKKG